MEGNEKDGRVQKSIICLKKAWAGFRWVGKQISMAGKERVTMMRSHLPSQLDNIYCDNIVTVHFHSIKTQPCRISIVPVRRPEDACTVRRPALSPHGACMLSAQIYGYVAPV